MIEFNNFQLVSMEKTVFDRFDFVKYSYGYKKRKKRFNNYKLTVELELRRSQLIEFWDFYNDKAKRGLNPFTSNVFEYDDIEFMKLKGITDKPSYHFVTTPIEQKLYEDLFTISLELVRTNGYLSVVESFEEITKEELDSLIAEREESCNRSEKRDLNTLKDLMKKIEVSF